MLLAETQSYKRGSGVLELRKRNGRWGREMWGEVCEKLPVLCGASANDGKAVMTNYGVGRFQHWLNK